MYVSVTMHMFKHMTNNDYHDGEVDHFTSTLPTKRRFPLMRYSQKSVSLGSRAQKTMGGSTPQLSKEAGSVDCIFQNPHLGSARLGHAVLDSA